MTVDTDTRRLGQVSEDGMACYGPDDAEQVEATRNMLLDIARSFGYRFVRVPSSARFEDYARLYGHEIRQRLFTFATDEEYTLRPDLTLGVCQYVARQEGSVVTPLRLITSGSAFRYERVRPLRLREFTQVSVERLGPLDGGDWRGADLECLSLMRVMLQGCGVETGLLRVGHASVRSRLLERIAPDADVRSRLSCLLDGASMVRDRFDPPREAGGGMYGAKRVEMHEHEDAQRVLEEHRKVLRRLAPECVSQDASPDALLKGFESALVALGDEIGLGEEKIASLVEMTVGTASMDGLCDALRCWGDDVGEWVREGLGHVESCVEDLEPLTVRFNLGFARGLGYYTGLLFELDAPVLGPDVSQLVGGGRYDEAMGVIGRAMPAVGFAIGLERLVVALRKMHDPARVFLSLAPPRPILVGFSNEDEDQWRALHVAETLRDHGVCIAIHPTPLSNDALDPEKNAPFVEALTNHSLMPYGEAILVFDGELWLADVRKGSVAPTTLGILLEALKVQNGLAD